MVNTEENKEIEKELPQDTSIEEKPTEGIDIQETSSPEETNDEEAPDLKSVCKERDEIKDQLIRALAENENIRKRAEKEKREAESYGITKKNNNITQNVLKIIKYQNLNYENIFKFSKGKLDCRQID